MEAEIDRVAYPRGAETMACHVGGSQPGRAGGKGTAYSEAVHQACRAVGMASVLLVPVVPAAAVLRAYLVGKVEEGLHVQGMAVGSQVVAFQASPA